MESFDIKRLRQGEQIAAVSAVLLLISMFALNWFGLKGQLGAYANSLGQGTLNAWDSFSLLRWLMLLTIIIALGTAFITATERRVALPVAGSVLTAASGILLSVLVFWRVIVDRPGPDNLVGAKFGAFLGLLFCIGIAVGGWRSMQDEGTSFRAAGDQLDKRYGDVGRGTSRPAPPVGGSTAPPSPPAAAESGPPPPPVA